MMSQPEIIVSAGVQSAYSDQYSDALTQWRALGAKYKAANLLEVCRGRSFRRVLDCGAGEGSVLQFLHQSTNIDEFFAVEISQSGVAQIQKRILPRVVEIRHFDGYKIPYPDKFFDLAYCSHVIEHVEHPRLLLRELKRVSRLQAFEVPLEYEADVDRRISHFLAYGHINIFTPSLFRFLIQSEGFRIEKDLLTLIAAEVLRFTWPDRLSRIQRWSREISLLLRPIRMIVKRALFGKRKFRERGFYAYTCLTSPEGDLSVLNGKNAATSVSNK